MKMHRSIWRDEEEAIRRADIVTGALIRQCNTSDDKSRRDEVRSLVRSAFAIKEMATESRDNVERLEEDYRRVLRRAAIVAGMPEHYTTDDVLRYNREKERMRKIEQGECCGCCCRCRRL